MEVTKVTELKPDDLFPIFSVANDDTRKASVSNLRDYMQGTLNFDRPITRFTQYYQPTTNNFNYKLTIREKIFEDLFLVLTPNFGVSGGTITFPASSHLIDGLEVTIVTDTPTASLTFRAGTGTRFISGKTKNLAILSTNIGVIFVYSANSSTWYQTL